MSPDIMEKQAGIYIQISSVRHTNGFFDNMPKYSGRKRDVLVLVTFKTIFVAGKRSQPMMWHDSQKIKHAIPARFLNKYIIYTHAQCNV